MPEIHLLRQIDAAIDFNRIYEFVEDLYCRPSCAECPSKGFSSGADLTLGDLWGYEKHSDDGVGVVFVGTERGAKALEESSAEQPEHRKVKPRTP